MENKDFDKLIAKKLSERTFKMSEDAWQRVENQLPSANNSSLKKLWWVAAVFLIGIFTLVMNWDKPDNTISDVENNPNTEIQNTIKEENIIQPIQKVENKTQVATSEKIQTVSNKKTDLKKSENNLTESIQNETKEVIQTHSEQTLAENNIVNQEFNSSSPKNEKNYNDLVMSKLKRTNTTFYLDSKDLLQLAETEIQEKQQKTLKEKVVEKVKNTVSEFNIAFK